MIETKLSSNEFSIFKWKIGFSKGIGVDSEERKSGIGLLWKDDVKLGIKLYDKYHMDVVVKSEYGQDDWRFKGFYGEAVANEK